MFLGIAIAVDFFTLLRCSEGNEKYLNIALGLYPTLRLEGNCLSFILHLPVVLNSIVRM